MSARQHDGTLVLNDPSPAFGDTVTFTVDPNVWVAVACYQDGRGVYGQYWDYEDGYNTLPDNTSVAYGGTFTLGPTALWTGGPAHAVATLYTVNPHNHKQTDIAEITFEVAG